MNAKTFALFFWRIIFVATLCSFSIGHAQTNYENYTFTHFAGPRENPNWHDGNGSEARFSSPYKVAVDQSGNIFVADYSNHIIRKVSSDGKVTTVAGLAGNSGSADGSGSAARFKNPAAVIVDGSGNLFVADYGNNTIRKITPAGSVTTIAGKAGVSGSKDGTGSAALFNLPIGLTLDDSGNLFVADSSNQTIRKISTDGKVTTFAGAAGAGGSNNGTGSAARFNYPFGITFTEGNLYVAELGNHAIRKITLAGSVTTFAGNPGNMGSDDGTGTNALFYQPFDIVSGQGSLFVADTYNQTIRQITLAGEVTTLAGSVEIMGNDDGTGSAAQFTYPTGVGVDGDGNVFVSDYSNNAIRKIAPGGVVTTFAGTAGIGHIDGNANVARFNYPAGITLDNNGNTFVADLANHTIRKITSDGTVSTFAGLAGNSGSTNGTGEVARFNNPLGIAADGDGNLFVADYGNSVIRKITSDGVVTNLAGTAGVTGSADGDGASAQFFHPFFLTVGSGGNIFVADTWNHTIRKITPDGTATTLAGTAGSAGNADGTGAAARFNFPEGIAADSDGNLFVADSGNQVIRKVTPDGVVTTFAGLKGIVGSADGIGSAARFNRPFGLAVDNQGNVFVANYGNHTIRKITPSRVVTTLAGLPGTSGNADGKGSAALFAGAEGLAVDNAGNLYVADSSNHDIRKGSPALPDQPVVDLRAGEVGTLRQLSVSNLTTTSWSWKIIRQPANSIAELSATNIANPTFTPDVADLFILRFEGKDDFDRVAIGNVSIKAGPKDVLSLSVSGEGTVSPNYSNTKLVLGKKYSVTAKPAAGYLFAGWTGDIESSSAKLSFTMSENLELQANFVFNPFPYVAGVYQGLFFGETNVDYQSSGFVDAKISTKGAFSAKIQLAGKSYSLSGPISATTGAFEKTIVRKGLPSLIVKLQVDLNGANLLSGQISDGTWISDLTADRNIYSKTYTTYAAGKYTLVIPGTQGSTNLPAGDGFATIIIDPLGNIKLAGTLGDATKISQKTILSQQLNWPLYLSPYKGSGAVLSWLTINGNSITNADGAVSWIRLPQVKAKLYPAGFTNDVNLTGAKYTPTNGVPLLNFTNGLIAFSSGNLPSDFTNSFTIDAKDKVTNTSSNKLSLSFTRTTGLFKGSVVNPVTLKSTSFTGVLLQNRGYGLFSGTNQTGAVNIQAAP